jgi:hypothetical protein
MKTIQTLLIALFILNFGTLQAQEGSDARLKAVNDEAAKKDTMMGWTFGGGIGLDLGGLGLLNPKVGAGSNRLGIGGLGTVFANKKEDKWFWRNGFSLQLSTQRLGRTNSTQPSGFQKSIDVMRFASRYGRKIGSSKWYAAADLFTQTQLLKTYGSNYLSPINPTDRVVSRFLSPLQLTISPGIEYKPTDHLALFYSPCGIQWIYVADDSIAATGVHGNDVVRDDLGAIISYENSFLGLGSEFKAGYANKYFEDRLSVVSTLRLFSNYLKEPQNIDVLATTTFNLSLFKGLSLQLVMEYFYDHDVKVQKDVNDDGVYEVIINPDGTTSGPDRLGRGAQWTGAFMLSFNKIF